MTSLHRLLLPRVLLVWLVLSLVAGGLTYWLEIRKIDQAVVNLAAAAIEHREGSHDPQFLASRANDFLGNGFVAVDILDAEGHNLGRAVSPGSESLASELDAAAGLARPDRPRYRTLHRNGATLVRVVIPLSLPSGGISGYFEGVYAVGPAHLAALRADLWRTLLAVLGAVLATSVAFYPVVLALNRSVFRASREVLRGNLEMASVLGAAIAKRDSDTNRHNFRVTLYACLLGEAMGVRGESMRALLLGAFLHDVGKIGIGDAILLKPGSLTPQEMAAMRKHVALGVEIIASSSWLRAARDVIQYHHEWYDGSGYLQGLRGTEIPLNARIFAVVDVFDALTSQRPYKTPWTIDAALAALDQASGTHFDPDLVAAFRPIAREAQPWLAQADDHAIAERLAGHVETHLLSGRPLRGLLRRRFAAAGPD